MMTDWSLPFAIATFSLASAAFLAIWQTRKLQERERRNRLLNEIIEWAIGFTNFDIPVDITAMALITDSKRTQLYILAHVNRVIGMYTTMRGRSKYMSNIALTFGHDLQKAIGELIRELEMHIKLLNECRDAIPNPNDSDLVGKFNSAMDKGAQHEVQLNMFAYKVIEKATKIKTKDVS